MFDLTYYNSLKIEEEYFDKSKGDSMSRKYLSQFRNKKKYEILKKRFEELPNNEITKLLKEEINKKGETGLTNISKIFEECKK